MKPFDVLTKVGVVDFAKIYNDTATAKQDRAELDQMMRQRQASVDSAKASLKESGAKDIFGLSMGKTETGPAR